MTTTTTTTTSTATTAIDDFLAIACGDHRTRPWADDAVIDAVVPGWRFAITGAEAIGYQLREWFRDPGTLEELRRHQIPSGEIVEFTVSWVENGIPHAARQIHVLDVDGDGLITHDAMWCGGRWPAELLAKMGAPVHAG